MAYTPTYVKDDIQPIVVDFLGTVGAEAVTWTDLLLLGVFVLLLLGIGMKIVSMITGRRR